MCFKEHCVKGYGRLHKTGKGVLCEAEQCAKVEVLKRIVTLNRKTTLPQITSEMYTHLQNPVSTKTISRELHAVSIHGRVAIPEPLASPQNAMNRRDSGVETTKTVHNSNGNR